MDATSLWAVTQKHGRWLGPLCVGLLLFVAGWFVGRAMSPYYAAHPIVFKASDNQQASAGGDPEALLALQAEGVQAKTRLAEATVSAVPEPSLQPTVAGIQATATPAVTEKLLVGSINSNLYHHKDCPTAKRIKPENQIWFATQTEAEAKGYSPSVCAKEKLNIK